MKLTLNVIEEYLPEAYQTKRYGYAETETRLDFPALYEEDAVWEEGRLYVARADILPKQAVPQKIALVCVGRRIPKEWAESNNQILLITQETNVFAVFNRLMSIYRDLDKWEQALLRALSKDSDFDIERLMAIGKEEIQNPISVSDLSLQIVLSTEQEWLGFGEAKDMRHISEEYFYALQGVCQQERLLRAPYLSALNGEDMRHYCYNLYPMGAFAGCIWIAERDHPFQKKDFLLAQVFFQYFQEAYEKYLKKVGSSNERALGVIRNILAHNMLTEEDEDWLRLEPGERWMFFKLKERMDTEPMPKDYMCAMVNTVLPNNAFAILHSNTIQGLWKCKMVADASDASNLQMLEGLLVKMGYSAGFSNKFSQIRTIGDQVLEAGFVVNEADITQVPPIAFFKDYILAYWLRQCEARLPLREFYSDGMARLAAHDERKNTEYLKTLQVYIAHQGNVSASARALFINRSSMIKRLDKIKSLLQSTLTDPDELLYYGLFFKLR